MTLLLLCALLLGPMAAGSAAEARADNWPTRMEDALGAARRDGRPILILIRSGADVASLDAARWVSDRRAPAQLLRRFHRVAAWGGASALKPYPGPPDRGLLFLTHDGKVIAHEPVPPRRAGLARILRDVLAYPLDADSLARDATESPGSVRRLNRAVWVSEHLGKVDTACALLQAGLAAGPPADPAVAQRWRRKAAQLQIAVAAGAGRRLRAFEERLDALSKPPAQRDAGLPAELLRDAKALAAGPAVGPSEAAGFRPALAAFEAALSALGQEPGAAGADQRAQESRQALAPLVKARIEELRRWGDEREKALWDAYPGDPEVQLGRLRSLARGSGDAKAEAPAKALVARLLASDPEPDDLLAALPALAETVVLLGLDDQRRPLVQTVERRGLVGRPAALALMDLADEALAQGARDEAERCWRLALKASANGESPTLSREARAMRALAGGSPTPARALWERRVVLDVVVLVPDLPTFAAAVTSWTDRLFFPVLFQDDRYAPRFIRAFGPAHAILMPGRDGAAAPLPPEAIRGAILSSWGAAPHATASPAELRGRLRRLGVSPDGVVFGDGVSGETAGGLALAAGRFQGFEVLPVPRTGKAGADRVAQPGDHLSADEAAALAGEVRNGVARWGLPRADRWASVTLAGAYPYRYTGAEYSRWGSTYALDDLLGRAEDTTRLAVVGRLLGEPARSAYQAACSLFLTPGSALLFNTYGTNPRSIWGFYGMGPAEARLQGRLSLTHLHDAEATLDGFRARCAPWTRDGLLMVNSSGGAMDWSVSGGGGTADDFPVGEPAAMHVTHSGSAADPYNPDTLAGRALWGGVFLYFGSTAEPFLSSFEPPRYYAPRIAAGTPLAQAFRQRAAQGFAQPWRLMLVGDPQFALRRSPASRRPYRPEDGPLVAPGEGILAGRGATQRDPQGADAYGGWLEAVRRARWSSDDAKTRSLLDQLPSGAPWDGPGLAIALEEDLRAGRPAAAAVRWESAPDAARKEYAACVYARLAIGRLMDEALAGKDLAALLAHCDRLLTTAPAANFLERWLGRAAELARSGKADATFASWLARHAGEDGPNRDVFVRVRERLKGQEAAR